MSETKFNIGDKVKVTDNLESPKHFQLSRAGQVGVVVEVDDSDLPYYVDFDTVNVRGYYKDWMAQSQLELINDNEGSNEVNNEIINKTINNEETNQYKFKVGDIVKVIEDIYTLRTNKIGIIIEDDESSCPYNVEFDDMGLDGHYTEWFCEHDLKLVENSSPTTNNQSLEDKIIELIKQERPNAKSIVVNVIITEQVVNVSELNYSREF